MGLISSIANLFSRRTADGNYFFLNQSQRLGTKGAVWLDTEVPGNLYNEIPQYKVVIDRGASLFSNADVQLVDEEGKRIENEKFYKLFNNPNPMQSLNEFLNELYKQYRVYGNQFIYSNKPSSLLQFPAAIWNVSPSYIQPVLTGKVFEQTEKSEIIQYFQYQLNESAKRFETKDIIWMKITDLDNPLIGRPPAYSLRFPLTNTKLAYEFRNVIMSERGAIGILRPRAERDQMGVLPMDSNERKRIHDKYIENYGVKDGQSRIILENVEWDPMTYPTRDLLLFEEIDANQLTIIDHEGMSAHLFANAKATYENVKNGMIQTYQDTIIPFADQVAQAWTKQWCEPGQKIKFCYDHVSVLKSDVSRDLANLQSLTNSVNQMLQSGIIDQSQAQNIMADSIERYDVD